jgi:hypothetical protein
MTATCIITRPASAAAATFDEFTGRSALPAADELYSGACRVQRSEPAPSPLQVGDREVPVRQYNVSIPAGGEATAVNDIVEITACDGDAQLVGRRLRIRDVRFGSLTWQRDLVCEDLAPTTR